MSSEKKKIRLYEGLREEYGITEDDLKHFVYWGGDWDGSCIFDETGEVYNKSFSQHARYYRFVLGQTEIIPKKNHCPCGMLIQRNCYIKDKTRDLIIVIGSCCIKKFLPNGLKRRCEVCNEPHKRSTKNICVNCEKKQIEHIQEQKRKKESELWNLSTIKKWIIRFGKHKGKTFEELFKNYSDYVDWSIKSKALEKNVGTINEERIKNAYEIFKQTDI